MLITRSICIIGLLLLTSALGQAQRRELNYETQTVRLTGRLVYKTYYGPPNFGKSPKTDSHETKPILILDSKVLVTGRNNSHNYSPDETVRALTLVAEYRGEPEPEYTNAFNRWIKRFAYKRVVIEGGLFHAPDARHHTKVLLQVYTIKRARRK